MTKKTAILSASLVAVKGTASAPADAPSRQHEQTPLIPVSGSAGTKARKHPTRTGRPVTKEESKLAPFNLPLRVIQMLQDAADEHAAGNKSKFVQEAIEYYIGHLKTAR